MVRTEAPQSDTTGTSDSAEIGEAARTTAIGRRTESSRDEKTAARPAAECIDAKYRVRFACSSSEEGPADDPE
jgi:hypothetical protein